MTILTQDQVFSKIKFIDEYISSTNAASASKVDANANVSQKNIATLEAEINKDINIQINRTLVFSKIEKLFGKELASEYIKQIENHEIYVHDETSLKPYCASISMYPFLLNGMKELGGESTSPKHLESFAGSFINLVFAISSQFAGAIATVEFLFYFDYFARNDLGERYLEKYPDKIEGLFQHVVHSINQPAAARGYQSVFWNISIFDEQYFASIFKDFVFPDFSTPNWKSVEKIQRFFMQWLRKERSKALLTFPVVTAAMLVSPEGPIDSEFSSFCAEELALGNSFFIYQSDKADSLASCCRLRNEISEHSFSYSLGAGGVSTGSINVITMNMNRLIQQKKDIGEQVRKIHCYQVAYRELMRDYDQAKMLPAYSAGFISFEKQFLTIGVNGILEAAESQGITPGVNDEYIGFVEPILKTIYDENRKATKKYGYQFNTEFVPAENLGVKNAKWDKEEGLIVHRDCYNSYLYPVENEEINAIDKFVLHGKKLNQFLDGGSALHLNLSENLSYQNYLQLFNISARTGCNYFCTNVKMTICNECSHIDSKTRQACAKCNSTNVDYATRVIGYLKRVSSFAMDRQHEHSFRHYHKEHLYE